MQTYPWPDAQSMAEMPPEQLAAMSNEELVLVIHRMESRATDQTAVELDHRRYLERHELLRLVWLATSLPRKSIGRRTYQNETSRVDPESERRG